jgi:hypothetical protein
MRLGRLGVKRCYWRYPQLIHLGAMKWTDYPEYSKEYEMDDKVYSLHGRADDGVVIVPTIDYREVGRR